MRFFAALFLCLLLPEQAMACSCAADSFGPEASRKNIARAKYIVEGSVSFVAPAGDDNSKEFQDLTAFGITVSKIYKGDSVPMLSAYARTRSSCGISVGALQRQTFFILYPRKEDLILAGPCSAYISPQDQKELARAVSLKRLHPQPE